MTPSEKKATEAVVRAAKRLSDGRSSFESIPWFNRLYSLERAVSRLLREEAKSASKRKEKRRGK